MVAILVSLILDISLDETAGNLRVRDRETSSSQVLVSGVGMTIAIHFRKVLLL